MEKYYSSREYDCDKSIRTLMALRGFRYARNIVAAKIGARGLSQEIDLDDQALMNEFDSLIDYWGYEFDESECNLPAYFGGWIVPYDDLFENSFNQLLKTDDRPEWHVLMKIIVAEAESIPLLRSKQSMKDTENTSRGIGITWPEGYTVRRIKTKLKRLDPAVLCWDRDSLRRSLASRITVRNQPNMVWDRYYDRRQLAFKKKLEHLPGEIDVFNYYVKDIYPKLTRIPERYIEKAATEFVVDGHYASISCPLGVEQKWRDPLLNYLTYLRDTDPENQIDVPPSLNENKGMAFAYLEGHMLDMIFDRKYPMLKYFDLDEQVLNYSYLPMLLATEYHWTLGNAPGKLMEGIILPSIPVKPVILGREINLNQRYSGSWLTESGLNFLRKFTENPEDQDESDKNFYYAVEAAATVSISVPEDIYNLDRDQIIKHWLDSAEQRGLDERNAAHDDSELATSYVRQVGSDNHLEYILGGTFSDYESWFDEFLTGQSHDRSFIGTLDSEETFINFMLTDSEDESTEQESVESEEEVDMDQLLFGSGPTDEVDEINFDDWGEPSGSGLGLYSESDDEEGDELSGSGLEDSYITADEAAGDETESADDSDHG
jgi:hypothetical protein